MIEKTIIQCDKEDLASIFIETTSKLIIENAFNKFSNRMVDTHTACQILGITKNTLFKYVNEGRLINKGTPDKFEFDLSSILKTDTKKFSRVGVINFKLLKN